MADIFVKLGEGLIVMLGLLDWVYMLTCFITAYTVIKYANAKPKYKKWLVLGTGLVLAIVFGIMHSVNGGFPWFNQTALPYTFVIMLSFVMTTFLNKWIGLEAILDKVVERTKKQTTKK